MTTTYRDANKKYYEKNKQTIKLKQIAYYEANREALRQKQNNRVVCDVCGGEYSHSNKSRHIVTKQHCAYLYDDDETTDSD